ncbi:MAG: hypothetical protein P9X22_00345, partial [Candidatus Zapsychrus exili]|nr:hypothetical protein [Candidatus Zapsychrus exili]
MEWTRYTLGTKIKNLLFSLGAIGITFGGILLNRKKIISASSREILISILLSCVIGVHFIGHFFFHPFMWQRHFMPSIYIGFGLFIFWITKLIKNVSFNIRIWLYIAALLLLSIQAIQELKYQALSPQDSYARSCKNDLYGPSCDHDLYK